MGAFFISIVIRFFPRFIFKITKIFEVVFEIRYIIIYIKRYIHNESS